MNEKLQYATMLDIPVETGSVTYKRVRKKRVKKAVDPETVKDELVNKVNSANAESAAKATDVSAAEKIYADAIGETNVAQELAPERLPANAEKSEINGADGTVLAEKVAETAAEDPDAENTAEDLLKENEEKVYATSSVHKKSRKGEFKLSVIGVELALIVALIAGIFLTNAFYADSAINVFMRKVFSPKTKTVVAKTYDEFSPVMNYDATVEGGVMTVSHSGAVYSSLSGTVAAVEKDENGLYSMTIAVSDVFSSTIYGLKYAYLEKGDAVYGAIPVGYADQNYKMVFATDSGVITDYTLEDGTVRWS